MVFAANPNDEKRYVQISFGVDSVESSGCGVGVLKHTTSEQDARVKLKKLMKSVKPLNKNRYKAPPKQVAKSKEKKNMEWIRNLSI